MFFQLNFHRFLPLQTLIQVHIRNLMSRNRLSHHQSSIRGKLLQNLCRQKPERVFFTRNLLLLLSLRHQKHLQLLNIPIPIIHHPFSLFFLFQRRDRTNSLVQIHSRQLSQAVIFST